MTLTRLVISVVDDDPEVIEPVGPEALFEERLPAHHDLVPGPDEEPDQKHGLCGAQPAQPAVEDPTGNQGGQVQAQAARKH